jgi:hypothetical protein
MERVIFDHWLCQLSEIDVEGPRLLSIDMFDVLSFAQSAWSAEAHELLPLLGER